MTTYYNGAIIEYSHTACGDELHAIVHTDKSSGTMPFAQQMEAVLGGLYFVQHEHDGFTPVFARFFLSDTANQQAELVAQAKDMLKDTAVSIVEQPPLDGTKVALWIWLRKGVGKRTLESGMVEIADGAYRHLFTTSLHDALPATTSYDQTHALLSGYARNLKEQGLSLAGNCIRTWFFVQNVDVNYMGLVKARNDIFAQEGLTRDTHFIASTGIGGRTADWHTTVLMDTYAVEGLGPEHTTYLKALTHLSPTADYGVAFERGTKVDFADRSRIFISGTASIDHKGCIVHPGDIRRQTERMMENVAALLAEASCRESDIMQITVYLRDISDRALVEQMIKERYPLVPHLLTYARVCRPGWLVEMECMAVKENR